MKAQQGFLEQSVQVLASIGPKRALALGDAGIATLEDLLYYFPRRYLDRSTVTPIRDLKENEDATVVGRIIQADVQAGRKSRFVLALSDNTSILTCVWFSHVRYWQKKFIVGEWLAVSGKVSRFGVYQMTHPEFDLLGDDKENVGFNTGKIVPVYPSSEALTRVGFDSRGFRRITGRMMEGLSAKVEEILPAHLRESQNLMPLVQALKHIHYPDSFAALEAARHRLKFDELFFMQLMLAFRRKRFTAEAGGIAFDKVGDKVKRLIDALPFDLTEAQKKVLHEIRADMKSTKAMNRLLQGDVGSGKTIVALVTILIAVENGYQAALMAPTEILAEQHFLTIYHLLQTIDVQAVLLLGGQPKTLRAGILADIASGRAQIVIGTHALIQEQVEFCKLGLIIVDEQHRFGVMQRAMLKKKGQNPDVLVMTATPIPRTLSLTLYGDLHVSIIDQLPAGRKPVVTAWRSDSQRKKIYDFVRQQVKSGAQVFTVFPLVEESEKSDLKSAVESYEAMRATTFKDYRVGLLHGRMKSDEKETTMASFKNGDIDILVCTTVIEVGVDVPNATVMVVEHAERFGLAQLHQLRGRVGRGDKQSYCILIAYGALSGDARERLDVMAATTDGFKIADKDLELRGPGEFFGTKQSGLPALKIADVIHDIDILYRARKEAFDLVERDPQLVESNHVNTRTYFNNHFKGRYNLAWVG
ncbi:ATP-dependent DNA helicase RecG [candidate division KSB1 bacterium]|nr:ATP-dependent DNA helicase RecG [candidate division KSB1 bacterium]RQW01692.1 MAG: ATP-dependent DNA helicase RecG [candidate division KSB1 bacterium]